MWWDNPRDSGSTRPALYDEQTVPYSSEKLLPVDPTTPAAKPTTNLKTAIALMVVRAIIGVLLFMDVVSAIGLPLSHSTLSNLAILLGCIVVAILGTELIIYWVQSTPE